MGGKKHNESDASFSQRKRDESISPFSWSLKTCLLYGGAGIVAGVVGYYAHKWLKGTFEDQTDELIKSEYSRYEAKHHRSAEAVKRFVLEQSGTKRREAIINLVRNIEFHFYRNQQISDATALRSLSNIQLFIHSTFDVMPLTDLLRDNSSRLTPAEKHHNFNKVKVLCFCRLVTSLYVLLLRLWIHRIEINILGRQWLPQLIASSDGDKVSDDDLKTLQRELETCEAALGRSPIKSATTSSSLQQLHKSSLDGGDINSAEFHSSISESDLSSASKISQPMNSTQKKIDLFSCSRQSQYSTRQYATLYPPSDSTATVSSEANYVFLTSTRWLEHQPGLSIYPNLVKPIVEDILKEILPQHFINISILQDFLNQICDRLELQIFSPNVVGIPSAFEQTEESSAPSLLIVNALLPELINPFGLAPQRAPGTPPQSCQDPVDYSELPTISTSQRRHEETGAMEKAKVSSSSYHFDTSTLKSDDEKRFVQGCLAESRDLLESSAFRLALISSRQSLLAKVVELILEKFPQSTQNGDSFPLCRVFGRLCGVSELLLVEVPEGSQTNNALHNQRYLTNDRNEFAALFGELKSVEYFCGAVYLPSIMCPDLLSATV